MDLHVLDPHFSGNPCEIAQAKEAIYFLKMMPNLYVDSRKIEVGLLKK